MTAARLLPAHDRTPRAWKNGGGVTHDIAIFPQAAGDGDFLWRASLATIAATGPFSLFPGVDRALMPLRGDLAIDLGDGEEIIGPDSPARLFAGEQPVSARPVGEPCSVLNIMARRDRVSVALHCWTAARPTDAGALLLFATAPTTIAADGATFGLLTDDALLLGHPDELCSISAPVVAAELFL